MLRLVLWLVRDFWWGPHFGSGQSRPPRPHMLHGRLSLPLTPISIFPTTNSPRPHRQSQDQTRTSDHHCNNKINNTNPSLGRIPSLNSPSVKPLPPTPQSSSRNTASPCSHNPPSDANIVACTTPTSTTIHTDAGHRLRHLHPQSSPHLHLHLHLHPSRPAFSSPPHHLLYWASSLPLNALHRPPPPTPPPSRAS